MTDTWKLIIVDDEPRPRSLIKKMLKAAKDFDIAAECSNGYEAIEAVRSLTPDLMLLDVQMPEVDGFQVLQRLRGVTLPEIIFVTAYDNYALKAFEVHALDYLLKPFDEERFLNTLDRARTRLRQRDLSDGNKRILSMLQEMKGPSRYLERFAVRTGGRIVLVPTGEVHWIEAEDKYARLHTAEGTYLVRETLARLEASLNPEQFVRIHRSTIVRIGSVKEIHSDFHGDYRIKMSNGTELSLGRRYRDQFFGTIGEASR